MTAKRICVYAKDIQRITGKSERYGRYLLEKIKVHLNKQEHQFITIEEFCAYTGIKQDEIASFFQD